MLKTFLTRKRKGDENIGKLIVFAVTIIIAVGVLGTLAYFYNQSRKNATDLSILTSTVSNTADLTGAGFCNASTKEAYVKYDPIKDQYTLTCTGASGAGVNAVRVGEVRGIIPVTCNNGDTECVYKVNK